MTDAHTPSPDDADDREYMLLPPAPGKIESYLSNLEERGFDIELAVVDQPSVHSPGTLTVQFRMDELSVDDQEEDR